MEMTQTPQAQDIAICKLVVKQGAIDLVVQRFSSRLREE